MIIIVQTLVYFRESLIGAIQNLLRPYYQSFALSLKRNNYDSDDDGSDEMAFAEYDDEKGVVFYPPVYSQRYAAVVDCLMDERWGGMLQKIVDLGYHDMSFVKYLKDVPGVCSILGVDIENIPLLCSSDLLGSEEGPSKNDNPLQVTLFQGNAADPDYRLIGCDAVVAIEMIEHMLPHDLERLVHTVFGFIKPWVAVFTTPNGDFNVLFKSLQTNGFRRLDHFFEWSQEQFHDWCSNIVTRYPEYTVSCKGIGPGPDGTEYLGCCSQLALFVSKEYHKQHDLDMKSLALVADVQDSEIFAWDNAEYAGENYMSSPNGGSLQDLVYSNKQSCMTFVVTSPSCISLQTVSYVDKMSQCNIDIEVARSFLMFQDDDCCFNVLKPRRRVDNKVYVIEDIACRLNCSTFKVRKFSKHTLKLLAKNKMDTTVHTRDVVGEIKNLKKMLNMNKNSLPKQENTVWNNINWGVNAPFWNQYYKIVKEYQHPFETKTEEQLILDLICAEVHSIMDFDYDNEHVAKGTVEIPIEWLMKAVEHITNDVNKVRDLLEWNGYELVNNVVVIVNPVPDDMTVSSNDDLMESDFLSDVKKVLQNKKNSLEI